MRGVLMNFHRTARAIFAILMPCFAEAQAIPSNDEIHKILAERVSENEKDIGIVVGVIDLQSGSDNWRIFSYGLQTAGVAGPLVVNTVFEMACVTEVFTAVLSAV